MRNTSINKFQAFALSTSLAIALGANQACPAQQSPGSVPTGSNPGAGKPTVATKENSIGKPPEARKPSSHKPIVDTFGKPESLTADKAILDDVPQYTGKARFVAGSLFAPGGPAGALMVVNYEVADAPTTVKDWYANALRMYGWDITFQSPSVINATNSKSGNTVAIQIYTAGEERKGMSLMQIDYHRILKQ